MELSEDQTDPASLAALGTDAARLLCTGRFDALAAVYGYALAYDREEPVAIEQDLARCLTELGASSLDATDLPPQTYVKYFKPNSSFLFAVVECVLPTTNCGKVLLELVVTSKGQQKYVCLEDVSVLA
jgi:hypothetical protein